MFKNKISRKLSMYFALALLIFAVIIGSVFVMLFRNQSVNSHKTELESHAKDIAQGLSSYLDQSSNRMSGFGRYLKMLASISGTDVWIIDKDHNLLTSGRAEGHGIRNYNFDDLPANAEQLIEDGFKGETAFSEDFSSLLSELTLTVGTPVLNPSNEVIGVVLLHSPVEGVDDAILQGIIILAISILLALIGSFLLSLVFSYSFTKPLAIMEKTAAQLAEGEYRAKTNIQQNDEIGELAATMDVLAERLEVASHESERLETMRQDFVANISHELKTPITVIRGSLEALLDGIVTEPEKIDDYYLQMLNEAKFLQRLVNDLLDLSKLQSLDFVIDKTEISLCDVIEDSIKSASHLGEKEKVKIEFTKKVENCSLLGDYGRIRQMIMIILNNAIKFSPENETVDIILEDQKLLIKDKGIGISAKDLPYIFDRFYKARSEQNKTGTGLGLPIAKKIADRHHIQLIAESTKGEGTTFIFIFGKKNLS